MRSTIYRVVFSRCVILQQGIKILSEVNLFQKMYRIEYLL